MNKFRPKSNSNSLPLPVRSGTTSVVQCIQVPSPSSELGNLTRYSAQCAAQYTAFCAFCAVLCVAGLCCSDPVQNPN